MADLAAKVLQLSPEQHDALGHAIALAHAIHASIGGKGIGVAPGELADAYHSVDIYVVPRLRRCCDIMCIWPPSSAGGNDQVPYLARALGLSRTALQKAFDVTSTQGKHAFLCIYQDPPSGRSRIMMNCDIPIDLL